MHKYRVVGGNSGGKRSLGRPRSRCEDNIKLNLTEIGWGGIEWIHLAQERNQWRAHYN
jgi:hypothetical protein